ncbi:MAG: 3'(2'),5'-bisphosphate nucleotidase CysQ [Rhizobiales bacterium]|nr:3'(2'),5'-bisphosphate nucleotidase CysQ [Hyphomicrobiales bacterium]NRB13541.1 3'(2'),5'-bisphosphate nucleotidase CysQ [Hyphomicrobiales bacterium]
MSILSAAEIISLQQIVQQAGQIGLSYFGKNVKNWQKSDNTPVSEADLKVNEFLEAQLKAFRPEFGWLSEETIDDLARQDKQYIWVIDPIDGTKAFIKGDAEWVVSVAIVKNNRPVAGVVYDPVAGLLYFAQTGQGAHIIEVKNGLFLPDAPLKTSIRSDVNNANLLAYKFHFDHMAERSGYVWPDMNYSNVNSMALRVALVAQGKFDAMVSFTQKSEWDIAAADIIIHEAGGRITDGYGNILTYNKTEPNLPHMVAAGGEFHRKIIQHTMNFNFLTDTKM